MQLDRLNKTYYMALQVGLVTLSFLNLHMNPERGWFTKVCRPFSFLLAWIYGARSSRRDITGAKAVHKAGDLKPDTSLCDSVKSTLKAYLSEAETKDSGLIFGNVNLFFVNRENTMTLEKMEFLC
jgi:hypothetical protein